MDAKLEKEFNIRKALAWSAANKITLYKITLYNNNLV